MQVAALRSENLSFPDVPSVARALTPGPEGS